MNFVIIFILVLGFHNQSHPDIITAAFPTHEKCVEAAKIATELDSGNEFSHECKKVVMDRD